MENFTQLLISNLPPHITEAQIVSELKKFGSVHYVKLKKSRNTTSCIIKFLQKDSAFKARNSLNGRILFTKRVSVSFPECFPIRDPSKNLFIKKIPAQAEIAEIEEIFKVFGTILNSKIVYDKEGNSLGYGFLMFENRQSVEKIMCSKNGFFLAGVELEVNSFIPKVFRPSNFCNVFIKGFPENYSADLLIKKFETFGEIDSPLICQKNGQSFAFVSYKDPASAEKAISELDNKVSEGIFWLVRRNLNKCERAIDLKHRRRMLEEKWQKNNLYIKNWPLDLTEHQLKLVFSKFGEIESVKFLTKECLTLSCLHPVTEVRPTGQVFICFSTEKSAETALVQMRNTLINNAPLSIFRWVPRSFLRKKESLIKPSEKKAKSLQVPFFNTERLKQSKGDERKRVFGEAIYQEIFCKYENLTGKITGMIIELDEDELLLMMQNRFLLYNKAKEAVKILRSSSIVNKNTFNYLSFRISHLSL